jgi:hypothetical protein
MNKIIVRINNSAILEKLRAAAFLKAKEFAYKKAYKLFLAAKKKMLQDFDDNLVTKELLAGMDDPFGASNLSGTLSGGDGNLYAFLGFENGKDPISPLRDLLEERTTFRYSTFRNNYRSATGSGDKYYFRIDLPPQEAIESVTQMDWESGNSWCTAIEKGVSNLSFFLSTERGAGTESNRSGGGTQIKNTISDFQFQTVEYLTAIFRDFSEEF